MQLQADEIRIAAASNLRYVLPELATEFEKQTGHQLAISYAASGTLTTQIQHGAPFDVFLSADPYYIKMLIKSGIAKGEPANYAQAQLALYASHHSSLNIDEGMLSLKLALEQGTLNKVAIANPRHAPYGQAAKKALEKAGIWQQIQPHLLMAENASQAVQFSLSSSVDAGLVPFGHIIQPKLALQGRYIILSETLQQQGIAIKKSSDTAQQFLDFILKPAAKLLFQKNGFL